MGQKVEMGSHSYAESHGHGKMDKNIGSYSYRDENNLERMPEDHVYGMAREIEDHQKRSADTMESFQELALPGESADGRMGADIQLLITDITDYRDLLNRHTADDKANLAALEQEIDLLEFRQMKIESRIQKRTTAKNEYLKTLADTEKAFNQIVNTANSVANILKPPTGNQLDAMDVPETAKVVDAFDERKGMVKMAR